MPKISAGILLFRRRPEGLQVLLVHPGGPFWKNRDKGTWSIPKGEAHPGEDLFECAKRECEEEIGFRRPGPFIPLTPVKLRSGKLVHAWACEADFDPAMLKSNTFTAEWPPHSGKIGTYIEVDRAEWFTVAEARIKMSLAQMGMVEELEKKLAAR